MIMKATLAQQAKQLIRPSVLSSDRLKSHQKLARFHHSTVMQERAQFTTDFFFRQMFDDVSCTYTYLLGDVVSKEAILIDPGMLYMGFCLTNGSSRLTVALL